MTDTATLTADPAVLATKTGVVSFYSEALDIVTQFAATATNMAPSDRTEFMSEYLAEATNTAATMPGNAAGLARMDRLSVSCAVAALIAAVAVAL